MSIFGRTRSSKDHKTLASEAKEKFRKVTNTVFLTPAELALLQGEEEEEAEESDDHIPSKDTAPAAAAG